MWIVKSEEVAFQTLGTTQHSELRVWFYLHHQLNQCNCNCELCCYLYVKKGNFHSFSFFTYQSLCKLICKVQKYKGLFKMVEFPPTLITTLCKLRTSFKHKQCTKCNFSKNKNLSVWHFNVFYIYLYIMQTCTLHILRKHSEFKASKNNEYLKTSYCQLLLYKDPWQNIYLLHINCLLNVSLNQITSFNGSLRHFNH